MEPLGKLENGGAGADVHKKQEEVQQRSSKDDAPDSRVVLDQTAADPYSEAEMGVQK